MSQAQKLEELCRGLKASEKSAFEELFRTFRNDLLRYVRTIVVNETIAHDLVQDVFTYLWDKRQTLDPSLPLKPYLYRMARNGALRFLRDERTHRRKHELIREGAAETTSAGVERLLDEKDLAARLRSWVKELPERQREAITLSRLHELTHREVADLMGLSPRTVNNHIVRALRTLEARLASFERIPNLS